jgi:hypothetical protein
LQYCIGCNIARRAYLHMLPICARLLPTVNTGVP